jgi:hypothetical protein
MLLLLESEFNSAEKKISLTFTPINAQAAPVNPVAAVLGAPLAIFGPLAQDAALRPMNQFSGGAKRNQKEDIIISFENIKKVENIKETYIFYADNYAYIAISNIYDGLFAISLEAGNVTLDFHFEVPDNKMFINAIENFKEDLGTQFSPQSDALFKSAAKRADYSFNSGGFLNLFTGGAKGLKKCKSYQRRSRRTGHCVGQKKRKSKSRSRSRSSSRRM